MTTISIDDSFVKFKSFGLMFLPKTGDLPLNKCSGKILTEIFQLLPE